MSYNEKAKITIANNNSLENQGFTEELKNYFIIFQNPHYSLQEIYELIDKYDLNSHLSSSNIIELLYATEKFLNETAQGYFKKVRDEKFNLDDILKLLNTTGDVFNKTQELLINDNPSSPFILAAIEWCKTAVLKKLTELKNINDRVFYIYKNNNNTLKDFIK